MPPRRRSTSGYRGVRTCPSGMFYAEIHSGAECIGLGTFETAHEEARAYGAVSWRLSCSRWTMNFHDVSTWEHAELLAPAPPAVMREQQQRQRELEQRLVKAELDESLRLEWARQFLEDVAAMEAFYEKKAAKKADREERRAMLAARRKEREEKAARKAKEKKYGAGPLTIVLSSSSSFEWTSTPVSSTSLGSSDFDWHSE